MAETPKLETRDLTSTQTAIAEFNQKIDLASKDLPMFTLYMATKFMQGCSDNEQLLLMLIYHIVVGDLAIAFKEIPKDKDKDRKGGEVDNKRADTTV